MQIDIKMTWYLNGGILGLYCLRKGFYITLLDAFYIPCYIPYFRYSNCKEISGNQWKELIFYLDNESIPEFKELS